MNTCGVEGVSLLCIVLVLTTKKNLLILIFFFDSALFLSKIEITQGTLPRPTNQQQQQQQHYESPNRKV